GPVTFRACKQRERPNAWRTSKIASGRRVGRSGRGRLSAAQGKGLRTHPPGHIDVSIEAGREDLRAIIGGSIWHGRGPDSCGPAAAGAGRTRRENRGARHFFGAIYVARGGGPL